MKMTNRTLEIKTNDHELHHPLPLTAEDGETLTMSLMQATAASLLPDKEFSLCYTDSDGDHVTITSDADLKELDKYMQDEQLQQIKVVAVQQKTVTTQRASTVVQTQLRGLVTAISKLTAKPETKPTPTSAMNMLMAGLHAVGVAEDAEELATIKKELLLVLQDETFRTAVEELSVPDEFKELADAMVAAIYEEDAQAIEDVATARFDELVMLTQHIVARCPSLKPVVVNVTKSLMTGLVRCNDEEMDGNILDSSSCSSSSSCCSDDHETEDVDVLTEEVSLHLGIACDGCEKAPHVGVRYKSLEVRNFDLCEECEASGKYMRYEPFIKITDPSRAPKQKRTSELVHPCVTCDGCEMSPIAGVHFKSQMMDDFDLCGACEASGKWTESHGPFTKVEGPAMMRAFKFTCRRGGKFGHHGHHGMFGRHRHGHGGKFGPHHGKFGRHHGHYGKFSDDEDDHHHSKFHHGKHHKDKRGRFGHHGRHHGPPEFVFHGRHPGHHGPQGFPGHDFPFQHEVRSEKFPGHDRPDFHGHHDHGPPFEFDDRRRHHGPPEFGSPGCFGRFHFDFVDPRGSLMCPRDFEYSRPPFPAEFERWGRHGFHGHHGHHGRHGRHKRFSDDEEEDSKQEEGCWHRRRHGRGRGSWGRGPTNEEAQVSCETETKDSFTHEEMEIVDTTEVRGTTSEDVVVVIADAEDKVHYNETLKQLVSMGFVDIEKNILALELARGNIGGAVNALLSA